MTMMMDNDEKNSARERVQHLLNKNVELENKRRKAAQARIPSDPNTWQNMRENYEAIVLEDHAFSEQHDVEYALWQLHYRRIEELRALFNAALASAGSQNGKGPVRPGPDRLTKIRSQFKTFLSEASGFYHDLMLKIRAKYGLPLGYFSDDPGNQNSIAKDGNKFSEVKKGLISCHRCLIYLGDLARYKSLYGEGDPKARDFAAASSYYMQASSIWPSSGNPHHQLAILAGYSNDELLTIYRYFRSLAVENPFITARDNLIIAFEKNRQNYTQILSDAKTATMKTSPRVHGKGRGKGETRSSFKDNKIEANTVKDKASNNFDLFKAFVTRFVRLNGILFTRTSLETFAEVFSLVKSDLLELLSSGPREEGNFGSSATECKLTIVRMIAILIFTVHNVNRESENQSYADILQRSVLLQNAFTATFEFMGCVLERCNQLSDPSSSYLLPGIMVFVEWLACFQDVAIGSEVQEKQVNARSFWKKCISFLNKLLSSGYVLVDNDEDETCFTSMGKYDESETANRLALPEDFELRGFLPLLPAQLILDFSRKHSFGCDGGSKERMARVQRIIAAGKALANIVRNGQESVYFDTREKKFVFGVEPQDDDYLPEPSLSVCSVDIPVGYQMASKTQIDVGAEGEDEDEDEVIVFKPPATEKHVNDLASTLTTTGVPSPVVGFEDVDSRNEIRSSIANDSFLLQGPSSVSLTLSDTVGIPSPIVGFDDIDSRNENRPSIANDSFLLQGPSNASLKLSDTVGNGIPWYPQSVQPNISNPVELGPILNSLAHLNFVENGPQLRSELQEKFGVTQSASFSIPYPQFVSSQNHSIQTPQATMLSKFDSVMTSKASVDELSVKPSTLVPPSQKKNPVSRPVRHFGPPPGFSSFPSKAAEELLNSTALKNENRPIATMDDYRWLDGYQLASENESVGFSSSINHADPTAFPSASKSNDQMKITNFPFPGKQVSNMQVQSEKLKGWHEPFGGHMKQYVDHHTKFQNGNQQPTVSPQQYQGQSIWEGRFFV